MRILIAEDEDFSRNMLQGYLEKLGHEVVAASDGMEAWEILQEESIRLVITDWNMPNVDGIELIKRIRSKADAPYVYVILLTIKSDTGDIVEGIMEGADEFLTKPFNPQELQARIRSGERVLSLEDSLRAANVRMKRDLDAAAEIQHSLLPHKKPGVDAVDIAWVFRPCDELAGDIFNVFQLDSDNVGFYLLDVVGHGVPAALLSVTLSRFLTPTTNPSDNLFVRSDGTVCPPNELATVLNRRFPMSDHSQFFTGLFGTLNIRTRELNYVSAGHQSPVYVPANGEPTLLESEKSGLPIGIIEDEAYENDCINLSPGDRIIMYSDGLVEALNPIGELFNEQRMIECLQESQESLDQCVKALEEGVLEWCDGTPPTDDISVLAISVLDRP